MPKWKKFVDCRNYVYVQHPESRKPYCFPCLQHGAKIELRFEDNLDQLGRKVYLCSGPVIHNIHVHNLWAHRPILDD